MPIPVECECGKILNVPDSAAGKKVRCKECGASTRVPSPDDEPEVIEDDYGEPEPPAPSRKVKASSAPAPSGKVRAGAIPAPVGKKKSGKKKAGTPAAETGLPKWVIPAMLGFGLIVGGIGGFFGVRAILAMTSSGPAADAGPVTFAQHVPKDHVFKFDYPEGWEVASGGGQGGVPPWGTATNEDVSIDIRGDSKGAPIADMATLNPGEELPPEESAVAKVHQMQYELKYRFQFDEYEELPGGFYNIPFGEGWLAEFTANGGVLTGKIHGYRLTLVGGVHQINVICTCKEKNWKKNQPVFERVMKSISR
ncbi:MAG: hypothetical protein JNG89_01775 [Planctomycetaceae bacterium]|nr:hypothetical protein [Planctomycetaceae bacterium]